MVLATLVFLFGLTIGSFVNALVFRLHAGQTLWRDRSRCPHCGKKLEIQDLIPLLSFISLSGRCRFCSKPISWQYPLVELCCGLLFVFFFFQNFFWTNDVILLPREETMTVAVFSTIHHFFVVGLGLALFVFDFRFSLLPDVLTLPGIVVSALFHFFLGISVEMMIVGALIGGGFFALQYAVSRGTWVGGGDIRLGVWMGVLLGPSLTLVALFLAYVSGAIVGGALVVLGKKSFKSPIPFGTFLTAATIGTLGVGSTLLTWYVNAIG